MIEFTAQEGGTVAINPALVWHIRTASGEQTAIYAATGAAIFVSHPYAEVLRRLRAHESTIDA